jgi:type IV pilus biogenesis protein CpaD/CtpE
VVSDQGDDLMCFGNTHEAFHRLVGKTHFVAAGSVGCGTLDDMSAQYAVIDVAGPDLMVNFRSVPYDHFSVEADMQAAEYIAKGDPRAAQAALVAARHFIANGHTNAASDLLLQLIASGLADHQAQRLLVDVVSSLGKRDVARAKCALLAEALRLDGQDELAVEVERLAGAV